ncbi:GGDEF domain-containing protein [Leucobacter massiliensis]|uniref:GGDEF domain-containing protein n=1 Tax=Leucobacter massiliensis TaxID=1686285 RepID=A0A2S9QPJ8_9MICO|nr:GGDEF domain-containing protein [Leucobacter massiliensis]PRI11508.1 hypothetical protein B4915_06690 [Leucobacter massiliensis]
MDRRRRRLETTGERGAGALRETVERVAARQTPFSVVSAAISLQLALVIAVELVSGTAHDDPAPVIAWLGVFLVTTIAPLLAGGRFRLWMGLVLAGLIELWSTVLLVTSHHPPAEITALLALPFSALYLGWFFPRRIAFPFAALSVARVWATPLWNPGFGSGLGEPEALLSYATLVAVFVFGGARAVRSQALAQAATDALTGVLNRRGLRSAAERMLRRARRRRLPVTLAVIDFDDFKYVNDAGGHSSGDLALRESAQAWRRLVGMRGVSDRSGGLVARVGGDEFVVLLLAERGEAEAKLRRARRDSPHAWSWGSVAVGDEEGLDAAIARADRELYRAKGRE